MKTQQIINGNTFYCNNLLLTYIKKLNKLDESLPSCSMFYAIVNIDDLSFVHITDKMEACLGCSKDTLLDRGHSYFKSIIHPDDIDMLSHSVKDMKKFTYDKIPSHQKSKIFYTTNYRIKNASGDYLNIVHRISPIVFDDLTTVWGLSQYIILDPNIKLQVSASIKRVKDNHSYETLFFKNYSNTKFTNLVSNRERDIIKLLVLKNSSKEIAEKLFISPNTVDTHRRNILKKFKLSSTGELIGMMSNQDYFIQD